MDSHNMYRLISNSKSPNPGSPFALSNNKSSAIGRPSLSSSSNSPPDISSGFWSEPDSLRNDKKNSFPKEVRYVQIKDNFWYGSLGDFKLVIDKNTGFFNASQLCQLGGKLYYNWRQTKQAEDLMASISSGTPQNENESIYSITRPYEEKVRGTYVFDDMILSIANWISPEFFLKCNKIVKDYYKIDFKNIKDDDLRNVEKFQQLVNKFEKSVRKMKDEKKQMSQELRDLKKIASPYTKDKGKRNCLVIYDKNDDKEEFKYYVIRCQRRYLPSMLKRVKSFYPMGKILYEKIQDPNSIKQFHLVEERGDVVKKNANHMNSSLTPEQLRYAFDNNYKGNWKTQTLIPSYFNPVTATSLR